MRPDGPRATLAGPDDGPVQPLPIKLQGPIIKGFGRGSKELGIPTANLPPEGLSAYPELPSGIYYGFVGLSSDSNPNSQQDTTFAAVLSIGFNPFYKNTVRSVEIHILHEFEHDFYGAFLNLLILGFIRPEYDYVSKESLIDDINTDCQVARDSLARAAYSQHQEQSWLKEFEWSKDIDTEKLQDDVLGSSRT